MTKIWSRAVRMASAFFLVAGLLTWWGCEEGQKDCHLTLDNGSDYPMIVRVDDDEGDWVDAGDSWNSELDDSDVVHVELQGNGKTYTFHGWKEGKNFSRDRRYRIGNSGYSRIYNV